MKRPFLRKAANTRTPFLCNKFPGLRSLTLPTLALAHEGFQQIPGACWLYLLKVQKVIFLSSFVEGVAHAKIPGASSKLHRYRCLYGV